MKKHIAGFILFSFILVSAAFIANIARNLFRHSETTHCNLTRVYPKTKTEIKEIKAENGRIAKNSPVVRQAPFNLGAKQIHLQMAFGDDVWGKEDVHVKLNYFRNNSDGLSFIKSETVTLLPQSFESQGKDTIASVVSSYEWLDNLDSYENLYITVEYTGKYDYARQSAPKFDAKFAKEISLYWGKSRND